MSLARNATASQSPTQVTHYERHRPEQTLLYRLVEQHYPAFKASLESQGQNLPRYIQQEFEAFLECVFGDNYKWVYRVNYNDTSRNIFSSTLVQSRINPSGARYARILDCTRLPEDLVEHEVYG